MENQPPNQEPPHGSREEDTGPRYSLFPTPTTVPGGTAQAGSSHRDQARAEGDAGSSEPAGQGPGRSSPVGSDVSAEFNAKPKNPRRHGLQMTDPLDLVIVSSAINLEVVGLMNILIEKGKVGSQAEEDEDSDSTRSSILSSIRSSIGDDLRNIVCPERIMDAEALPGQSFCVWNSQPREENEPEPAVKGLYRCQYCKCVFKFMQPEDPKQYKTTWDFIQQQDTASADAEDFTGTKVRPRYHRRENGADPQVYGIIYTEDAWKSRKGKAASQRRRA